jgi:metal-dependent HD superfamily phosphatase/phosphodiesterase
VLFYNNTEILVVCVMLKVGAWFESDYCDNGNVHAMVVGALTVADYQLVEPLLSAGDVHFCVESSCRRVDGPVIN